MFGLFARGPSAKMNSKGGNQSLLADGTFMLWLAIGVGVVSFVLLILLASGSFNDLMLLRTAQEGYREAYDGEFIQKMKLWSELKPIVIIIILAWAAVQAVANWSTREPHPIILYEHGSKPTKLVVENAQPADDVETLVPQVDQVTPKQLNRPDPNQLSGPDPKQLADSS